MKRLTIAFLGGLIAMNFTIRDANSTERVQGTAKYLRSLSTDTQEVVKQGIYKEWIHLGRAPTQREIEKALGKEKTEKAFRELKASEFAEMFSPGTESIRWFWPFSTKDHGVTVTLAGEKTIYARCAVDALGMSQMFGKIAVISVRTPLLKKEISFTMSNDKLKKFNSSVVVSEGEGCEDLLFFSSRDEFEQFKEKSGRKHLKMMSLNDAVKWGLASFGSIFN